MKSAPVDIVDRSQILTRAGMVRDYRSILDGALDEISRRDRDRQDALDAIHRFIARYPGCDHDDDLTTARLSLMR